MDTEGKYLEYYCGQDAKRLNRMVDQILRRYGGIYQKDLHDFYSVAGEVVWDAVKRYDGKQEFEGFLYVCLDNRIKTEITRRNREKRKADRDALSLDAPIGEDTGLTLGDTLVSEFSVEEEAAEHMGGSFGERAEKYLDSLSAVQRKIVRMKMEDVPVGIIRERLALTEKQYVGHCRQIRDFSRTQILLKGRKSSAVMEEEKNMETAVTQTVEKSKQKNYCISSIIKKIENYTIRFDHSLQRESEQWSPFMKGNFISDILQGNPIPPLVFAEQIIGGMSIVWDLDGKQRCTNVYDFAKDGFRIARNIRRWKIRYQAVLKDENGWPEQSGGSGRSDNPAESGIFMRNGSYVPSVEWRECDIRGKKYSELPEELQERFQDYVFDVTQYLNCSSEDIAYHIARYNEGKPMTVSQKGMTRLGEEFAVLVKGIANMDFFKDKGNYKLSEFRNGTVNRVIVESIMAVNYLDDWKKRQEDMCQYIHDYGRAEDFKAFAVMVSRLTEAVTDDCCKLFDSKDSFLWMGLFSRFCETGQEDGRFAEFMGEFAARLHGKKVEGVSFDDMREKPTKDKAIVVKKMEVLTALMGEYLLVGK